MIRSSKRLALAHDVILVAVDQHLGRLGMRIVVRRHGEAVGAGAHHREQIAALRPGDLAVLGEKVAALANRPDDIGDDDLRFAFDHRPDRLIRAVKRRPDQIVHAAVDDDEFFRVGFFDVLHFGQQNSGVADDHPARLENQRDVQPFQPFDDRLGVVIGQRRRFVVVVDAQAAAEIEIANLRAFFFHLAGKHAVEILAHLGQARRRTASTT